MVDGQRDRDCGDFDDQKFITNGDTDIQQEIAEHNHADMVKQINRIRGVGKIAEELGIPIHETIKQDITEMAGKSTGQAGGIDA